MPCSCSLLLAPSCWLAGWRTSLASGLLMAAARPKNIFLPAKAHTWAQSAYKRMSISFPVLATIIPLLCLTCMQKRAMEAGLKEARKRAKQEGNLQQIAAAARAKNAARKFKRKR